MIARLHHELVAGPSPARWLLLVHGILGSGPNLRGIARKLVERRPEWGVALVDLRQHGRSEAGQPPHTIAACAADLVAVPVDASVIAGHSFGGKVALAARRLRAVAQTWVLDASPSPRPQAFADPANTAARLVALMETLPRRWARRDDFVAAVVAAGHPTALAQWLAMNLRDGEVHLDLAAIRAMLESYYVHDAWDTLALPGDVEIVVADRSSALSAADLERLRDAPPNVHVHHLDAGHWLHVDAPGPLVDLFVARLP